MNMPTADLSPAAQHDANTLPGAPRRNLPLWDAQLRMLAAAHSCQNWSASPHSPRYSLLCFLLRSMSARL